MNELYKRFCKDRDRLAAQYDNYHQIVEALQDIAYINILLDLYNLTPKERHFTFATWLQNLSVEELIKMLYSADLKLSYHEALELILGGIEDDTSCT